MKTTSSVALESMDKLLRRRVRLRGGRLITTPSRDDESWGDKRSVGVGVGEAWGVGDLGPSSLDLALEGDRSRRTDRQTSWPGLMVMVMVMGCWGSSATAASSRGTRVISFALSSTKGRGGARIGMSILHKQKVKKSLLKLQIKISILWEFR
jgi:hypothetical protein